MDIFTKVIVPAFIAGVYFIAIPIVLVGAYCLIHTFKDMLKEEEDFDKFQQEVEEQLKKRKKKNHKEL